MRKLIIAVLMPLFMVIMPAVSRAEHGATAGLGFPAGYMDYSIDAFFYQRFHVYREGGLGFRLQGLFSTKGDGHKGRLYTTVGSAYLLGRYVIATYIEDMTPFVAPGAGFHVIYSWATNSPLKGFDRWTLTTKAHLFYGMEYKLGGKAYLIFEGRMTYPSDILFDSWFLGFASRL